MDVVDRLVWLFEGRGGLGDRTGVERVDDSLIGLPCQHESVALTIGQALPTGAGLLTNKQRARPEALFDSVSHGVPRHVAPQGRLEP